MTDKIVVLSTCESLEQARQIASELVAGRLAACVNIVPGVESVYRWQGKIESSAELMLVIKTSRELLAGVEAAVARLHSYQVPELIAAAIVDGSPAYLEWLGDTLRRDEAGPR